MTNERMMFQFGGKNEWYRKRITNNRIKDAKIKNKKSNNVMKGSEILKQSVKYMQNLGIRYKPLALLL